MLQNNAILTGIRKVIYFKIFAINNYHRFWNENAVLYCELREG